MGTLFKISGSIVLALALMTVALAQDTTTKTTTTTRTEVIQNQDGSYTVIEYPVGKEITVELTPVTLQGAMGTARVMRAADGTRIALDLSGVTGDSSTFYVYAVDPTGNPTFLGPVTIQNGTARSEFMTPMSRFMLVLSPNEGVRTFSTDVPVVFRSAVPTGHAIVPMQRVSEDTKVATTTEVASAYEVPLLGVPRLGTRTTEININFTGELEGLTGKAYINPERSGVTKIKMRFDDMKKAPMNARFVLWAASADGKYTKLGQVVNAGARQESEIRSETAMKDFGLFVTMEDDDVDQPRSRVFTILSVNQNNNQNNR